MREIVVKPRAGILHEHDWVFSSEVLKVFGKPADGDVISLKAVRSFDRRLETFASRRVKSRNRKSANTIRSLVTELK